MRIWMHLIALRRTDRLHAIGLPASAPAPITDHALCACRLLVTLHPLQSNFDQAGNVKTGAKPLQAAWSSCPAEYPVSSSTLIASG